MTTDGDTIVRLLYDEARFRVNCKLPDVSHTADDVWQAFLKWEESKYRHHDYQCCSPMEQHNNRMLKISLKTVRTMM
jgi:hypothetical protein